jgi:hypothetical protein
VALGKGRSKPLADQVGAANLFLRHVKTIRGILAEHGKRMVLWTDPFEPDFFKAFGLTNYGMGPLAQVPRDVILAPWHYGRMDSFDFGEKARAMGFDLCPWSSMGSTEIFPRMNDAAVNVETYIPFAHRQGALGAVHSNWGDFNSFREYNWPGIVHYAEWAWRPDGRPYDELLPLACESFYGPGAGAMARACRFLGDLDPYFGWRGGWSVGHALHFDPVAPRALDAKAQELLARFQRDCQEARSAFGQARAAALRNTDDLESFHFALDQIAFVGDLVSARHLLAQSGPDGPNEARALLGKIERDLPKMQERYEAIWLSRRMARGLEPHRERYAALRESLGKALANAR